jgi:hypothetical protein
VTSARQHAANGRNAGRSTGPTSEEGKAVAAQNARSHGLTAAPPEGEVNQWLRLILNQPILPSAETILRHEGLRRARRLAEAEARLALLRRSLDSEAMPIEVGDPDQRKYEEIRKEIGSLLREPWKYGNNVEEAMLKFEHLREMHRAHEEYLKLSARYLREARSARKRAFKEWLKWQRETIS